MSSKWVHRLSEVNEDNRTAVCANCGPVGLFLKKRKNGVQWWRCKKAHNKSFKTKNYRKRVTTASCPRCGFVPVHICQMDVHHKDYDHSNNNEDNLEVICSNCHRLEHTKQHPRMVKPGGVVQ